MSLNQINTNQLDSLRFQFDQKFLEILDKEITPENILGFESKILSEIVAFVQEVVTEYINLNPGDVHDSITREDEDKAFAFFNLGDVNERLDRVIALVNKISEIDYNKIQRKEYEFVFLNASGTSSVTGPKNEENVNINENEDRLDALVFLLSNMEIEQKDIILHVGMQPSDESFRKQPYYGVEVTELSRVVLVCNEFANATYIFDTDVLNNLQITIEDILVSSKEGLLNLIEVNPTLGKRVKSTVRWLGNIQNSLTTPFGDKEKPDPIVNIATLLDLQITNKSKIFFDEKTENHFSSIFNLEKELHRLRGYLARLVKDYNVKSIDVKSLGVSMGKIKVLYCLEDLQEAIKIEDALPHVDKEGKNVGFIFLDGLNYGPLENITEKIGNSVTRMILQGLIDRNDLKFISGIDENDQPCKLYPVETLQSLFQSRQEKVRVGEDDLVKIEGDKGIEIYGSKIRIEVIYGIPESEINEIIKQYDIKKLDALSSSNTNMTVYSVNEILKYATKKVDKLTGLYTDEEGNEWGTITTLSRVLKRNKDTISLRTKKNNLGSRVYRGLDNIKHDMYCLQDLKKLI